MSSKKDAGAPPKEEEKKDAPEEEKGPQDKITKDKYVYREVGQMKAGDYMIHVFIENARQLKVPDGATVDPLLEVSVLNEKKFTTAKDDIGATGLCSWNEHLFFEPKAVSVDRIEQAKISIRMLDKGYFKESLIGCYEFDVAYVYFQAKHALLHKWIALSNPQSENFNEVAGYLKLSICVSTVGDEQLQITEDVGGGQSDEVLMPPSIRPEFYQIRFKLFRAERLPALDTNLIGKNSIDAYIQCNYMNNKLQTDVITAKEGDPVNWNDEFLIPCQLPIMSSRVVMKIFDKDLVKDEIVGSLLFNLKECIDKLNGKFFWKNVYGAPIGKSGANTDTMNANPEMASTWKGRVLMQVIAEKTEKPQCIKKNLTEEDIEMAKPYFEPKEFDIIAEVGQGLALPDNSKYKVMIKIAELELLTGDPKNNAGCYNRWAHRFNQQTFKSTYRDVHDIGKIYFYLMSGKEAIAYYKADVEDFLNPNPEWKWLEMIPDLSVGKVKDSHKAGIISVKLSIKERPKSHTPTDFRSSEVWSKEPPKRSGTKKARAYVFQCRDLPAADSDGQSDPFIKIWDMTTDEKKTKVIEDNNNPLFFETLELIIDAETTNQCPPFVLDLYDSDTLGNDFIARCIIPIEEAAFSEDETIPKPKWHKCKLKPDAPPQGEILVSFSLVPFDYTFKLPFKKVNLAAEVPRKEFVLDINILGLRDLQSAGILPVKKAFIIFNLKSLVPPDDGRAVENVKTQPSAAGPNPTINTLIKFRVPLPVDKLFQPRLLCSVHDYIFKGFNQPLLGSFIIPVGDLIDKLVEERERETAAIQQILDDLDKISRGEGIQTYRYAINNDSPSSTTETLVMETIEEEKREAPVKLRHSTQKKKESLKQPLLLEYNDEDEEEKKDDVGLMMFSPRVNVRKLSMQFSQVAAQRKSTMANPIKAVGLQIDKYNSGMKNELINQQKREEEKRKRELQNKRSRDIQDFKSTMGASAVKNIIQPTYSMDERLKVMREINSPPETLFLGLGWDETPESKTKHYRRFYPQELETVKECMPVPSPFETFDLKKGQSRGASKGWSLFGSGQKTDASGETSTEQVVGKFKGTVTVQTEEDRKDYADKKNELIEQLKAKLNTLSLQKTKKPLEINLEKMDTFEGRQKFELQMEELGVAHLQITQHLADLESDESLKRLLMGQSKCTVRVYLIDAFNLSSRDNGSASDPYAVVSLGNRVYNERDNYQTDQPNPTFYKSFDFEAVFPGCAPLIITIMDYDEIFGDESIGTTSIDLEDRFFSPDWQSIKNKPIEHRNLMHASSSISQGTVRLWVEIHSTQIPQNEIPTYNIVPKPLDDFEIRVVIFDTLDVPANDIEGVSDIYIRSFFDSEDAKETDTHYRCADGKASFNYRLLYNLKHPRNDYNLSVQIWDRDIIGANDVIGETLLNIKDVVLDSALTKKPFGITKKYYNLYLKTTKAFKDTEIEFKDETTFWIQCKGKDPKDGKLKNMGKVRMQIDVFPRDHAEKNKVGEARQEPNHSPHLPQPEGRLSLDMNPIKLALAMIGPDLKRKIVMSLLCAVCLFLCVMLVPLIAGNILSDLIMKIF